MRVTVLFSQIRLWFVAGGQLYKVLAARTGTNDPRIAITNTMIVGPTTLPPGLYHRPPPFHWQSEPGGYLEHLEAAQPFTFI